MVAVAAADACGRESSPAVRVTRDGLCASLGPLQWSLCARVLSRAQKTYPALYALYSKGFFPPRVQIVGYARSRKSRTDSTASQTAH